MHSSRLQSIAVATLVGVMVAMAFAVSAPPVRANHDTVPWDYYGSLVTGTSTISNRQPAVLPDGHGHVYVFYVVYNSTGGVANLHLTKFNETGGLAGSPQFWFDKQVNDVSYVVSPGSFVSATMDHSGNLYVAWTHVNAGAPAYSDTYVSKSSDGGATWLPAVRAGNPSDGTIDEIPTIAAAPNGTIYVAWSSYKPSFWFYNIEFAMSTNGANTFINVKNVSGQGPGGQAIIDSMAVDSLGRIHLAYIGVNADFNVTSAYHINYTSSSNGVAWASPTELTPDNGVALYPSLAVDAQNRVHLAWLDYRTTFSTGPSIWYTRSDDRGASWTVPGPAVNGSVPATYYPRLAVHGDTVLIAVQGQVRIAGNFVYVMAYGISADGGNTWYREKSFNFLDTSATYSNLTWVDIAADANGTVWAAAEVYDSTGSVGAAIDLMAWNGPPSAPKLQSVDVADHTVTLTWTPSPENDVAGYRIYRSADGTNYAYLASVSASTTTYADRDLANGTYWYEVEAVDTMGTPSHASAPMSGTVGPTTQDLINALSAEIAALQAQLSNAQANLSALQTRITNLQTQLSNLQNSEAAASAASQQQLASLQANLTNLQNQLNSLKDAQATQTMSYVMIVLLIVVIVLLVALLARKPKPPVQMLAPMPGVVAPPPSPPLAPSREPEDEL